MATPEQRRAARQARAERAGFSTYGAYEYAQRKARAQRLGYQGGYVERERAKRAARAGDTSALARGDAPVGRARQIIRTPAGTVARTVGDELGGLDVVERQVQRMTRRGRRVEVEVTMSNGQTHRLYQRGGRSAADLRRAIEDAGGLDAVVEADIAHVYGSAYAGGASVSAIQVVIS